MPDRRRALGGGASPWCGRCEVQRLVEGATTVILAEFKSRVDKARLVRDQLQGGADLLNSIADPGPAAAVLIFSGKMGAPESRLLRTRYRYVVFRGRQFPVQTLRSGANLAEVEVSA